jgi:hypothetical protein
VRARPNACIFNECGAGELEGIKRRRLGQAWQELFRRHAESEPIGTFCRREGERASYRRWKARLDEQASTAATSRRGTPEAGRSDGGAVCRSGALGTMPTAQADSGCDWISGALADQTAGSKCGRRRPSR